MYCYIYDTFLKEKKYQRLLIKIENSITAYGLNGKIRRLNLLSPVSEVVADELKHPIHTLVVVGGDELVTKVIDSLVGHDVTLGIIPIGPDNKIAKMFGLPNGEAACDILARRVIKKINLGKINDYFFIQRIAFPDKPFQIDCSGQFRIQPVGENDVSIYNQSLYCTGVPDRDMGLVVSVQPTQKKSLLGRGERDDRVGTKFVMKRIMISAPESIKLLVDGQKVVKTPAVLESSPDNLKIIVGKND